MPSKFFRGFLLFVVFPLSLVAAPEAGRYLRAHDFDVTSIIPAAPADNSLVTLADIETVYQVQQRRTPEQIAIVAGRIPGDRMVADFLKVTAVRAALAAAREEAASLHVKTRVLATP